MLAGVGLALTSVGRYPHEGRKMAADRIRLVVRAVLTAVVSPGIETLKSEDPWAYNILIHYGPPRKHVRAWGDLFC